MTEKPNLVYWYYTASKNGEERHAQTVMNELGITYHHGVPQSIGDCWLFYECENVPENLPPYIEALNNDRP
jgi:hypothetical protein